MNNILVIYCINEDNTKIISSIDNKEIYKTLENLMLLYGYNKMETYLNWKDSDLPLNIKELNITIIDLEYKE